MPSAFCGKCGKTRAYDVKTLRCFACEKIIFELVARQCGATPCRTTSADYARMVKFGNKQ